MYELDAHTEGLRMPDLPYWAVEDHSPLGKVSNDVAPLGSGPLGPEPLGAPPLGSAPLGAPPLDSLYLPCLV